MTGIYPPDMDTPMLANETPLIPAELRALSGTVKPLTAPFVAAAMIRGTERGKATVIPDRSTRLLRFLAGACPAIFNRALDRIIAQARRRRPDGSGTMEG